MYKLNFEPYDLLHKPVDKFVFGGELDPLQIEKEMIQLMIENRGLGLAANQIGLNAQVFVLGSNDLPGFVKPQAFFNPIITKVSNTKTLNKEGCLSFPGLFMKISRPEWIEAAYQDTEGKWIEIRADGYVSKAFQHEFDHLYGICFTDRAGRVKLDMALKKMQKQRRN